VAGDGVAAAADDDNEKDGDDDDDARLATEAQLGNETESFLRALMWRLSTKHLRRGDWKKLAKHWHFTDEHIRAIRCQYTGLTTSISAVRLKGKGKVLPYSFPSVEPGADPGVQAVSRQVTLSYPPGGRLLVYLPLIIDLGSSS